MTLDAFLNVYTFDFILRNNFEVFGNVVKPCVECLIYPLSQY